MSNTSLIRRFSIKGWGPIVAEFTLPFRAGVGILKGEQGVGKSSCLEAVNAFLGGEFKVTANDIVGRAELSLDDECCMKYAAKRTFSKGTRPEDLLIFIEQTGSLVDFVKPSEKDPIAGDKRRIKWLLRMSGATVDFGEFVSLVPKCDGYPPLSVLEAQKSADLVDQAAKVKRTLETEARRIEGLATELRTKEQGLRAAIAGVDLTAPSVHAELQSAHTDAVAQFSRLDEQRLAAEKAKEAREKAGAQLAAAKSTYSGPTVADARQAADCATKEVADRQFEVARLEQLIKDAKSAVSVAIAKQQTAIAVMATADRHDKAIAEMTGLLEGELPQPPEQEDLDGAKLVMDQAAAALETSVVVRDALKKRDDAEEQLKAVKVHEKYAGKLRDAAAGTDEVLSKALSVPDLRALGGRLLYKSDGGEEKFDRLSDGQRWKVGIAIAATRVGDAKGDGTRVCTLEQAAWGELSPTSKAWVHQCALEHNVAIVTAEADDGDLRYEYFGETA